MTDAEQIEAWRSDFENIEVRDFTRHPHYTNRYWVEKVQNHWEGFLMAKRSQPLIELPEIRQHDNINYMYGVSDCKAAITAAGYKYKVKE